MMKIFFVAAFVALSGGSAFAGSSNHNNALVGNLGFFNTTMVTQGGRHNTNNALAVNVGAGNIAGIQQAGHYNHNNAASFQFGVGNGSLIIQN